MGPGAPGKRPAEAAAEDRRPAEAAEDVPEVEVVDYDPAEEVSPEGEVTEARAIPQVAEPTEVERRNHSSAAQRSCECQM